jgi:hypothetical protein
MDVQETYYSFELKHKWYLMELEEYGKRRMALVDDKLRLRATKTEKETKLELAEVRKVEAEADQMFANARILLLETEAKLKEVMGQSTAADASTTALEIVLETLSGQ